MGQYFYFVNKTKNVKSTVGLSCNGGLSFMSKLHMHEPDEQDEIFKSVINDNKWDHDDVIVAYGDSGDVIYYQVNNEIPDSYFDSDSDSDKRLC